jgi:hypothetical protein
MLKYDATGVAQRPMRSHSWKNQSLVGVGNRLLRHIDTAPAPAPHTPIYANFVDLKFAVNAIITVSGWLWGFYLSRRSLGAG